MTAPAMPPLSRRLAVSAVPPDGVTVEVAADPAEREALAALNEVESVERLFARLEARPFGRDGVAVRGTLEAEATRICVVTLELFTESVREEIDVRFAPGGSRQGGTDDAPDPLVGDFVDLGAIAAEFFTLGLDPHPRKPGASFDAPDPRDEDDSPFAALKALTGGPDTRK